MMLVDEGVGDIILCDSKGIIHKGREDLNPAKKKLAGLTNREQIPGRLSDAMKGADVFIGFSVGGLVTQDMVHSMSSDAIVFPLANPIPEIMPDKAIHAGARIVGTGRSDFPNQVNNVLGFPGVFRGALDVRASDINKEMKLAAAHTISSLVEPTEDMILPDIFDTRVAPAVASAVAKAAIETKVARLIIEPEEVAEHTRKLLRSQ
jgi:malate dehydrogenase (oxaloacetate-decarboxylating)